MNRISLALLLLFSVIALPISCAKNGAANQVAQTSNSSNPAVTTTANTSVPNAETDQTDQTDDGFTPSESGTAKAKPETGKANVQGKVLFDGKPAENIQVKLCEKFSQFVAGCSGEIFTVKTDSDGEYLFANITPRIYEALTVKVFETRGYVFPTTGFGMMASKYKIEPDETFFVSETNLFKSDLKVQDPKNASKINTQNFEVKWDAYPDASYYEISINGADGNNDSINEKVDTNSFAPDKLLSSGKYHLQVEAYNADKVKIADSGYDLIEFTITSSGAAGGDKP